MMSWNVADVTFNQALGINSSGIIAGYFGSGAAGLPNQGYTVAPPYAQRNFTNENFPGSVQTQVTGINNIGTAVGFWSDQNNANMVNNNFGFVDIANTFTNVNNPATGTGPAINQLLGVNNSNIALTRWRVVTIIPAVAFDSQPPPAPVSRSFNAR